MTAQMLDLRQDKKLLKNREVLRAWKKFFASVPVVRDFFAERLFGLVIKPPEGLLGAPTQWPFAMVINPREGGVVEQSIYRSGTYESGVLEFLAGHLKKGDHVVDIGANVGMISLFASHCVGDSGRVYSFEPVATTAALLRQSVELNGLKNITLHELGLSDATGEAPIFKAPNPNRGGLSLLPEGHGGAEQTVRLERLDKILTPEAWRKVTLVKVDVEGWELPALQGAMGLVEATGHAPALIVEYSADRGEKAKALYDFLKAWPKSAIHKLAFTKRCGGGLREVKSEGELPGSDNLFVLPKA